MIQNHECPRCGCKRDFIEQEDYFVCSTCGEMISFPDLIKAYSAKVYMAATILFAQKWNENNSEGEEEIPGNIEGEDESADGMQQDEDCSPSAQECWNEEDFFLDSDVSEDEKAQYCKHRFLVEMLGNYNHEEAVRYCERAAQYDRYDPYIMLLKGLGTDIPIYSVNPIDFTPFAGDIDQVKVCIESGGEGVLLEQEVARKLFLTPTVKAWMSILADYEAALACCNGVEQCKEIGSLAAMHLNLVGVSILFNELKNLKELPTSDRISGYRELQLLLPSIYDRFFEAIRRKADGSITLEVPEALSDTPDWNRLIHRAEGYTANWIIDKFVVPCIDAKTHQISKKYLVNFIDSLNASHYLLLFLQGYYEAKKEKCDGVYQNEELEVAELVTTRLKEIKNGSRHWTIADTKCNTLLKEYLQAESQLEEANQTLGKMYPSIELHLGFDETENE